MGALLADPRVERAREERQAVRVRDAEEEGALVLPGAPALRSWVALPLLLEGEVVGMLIAGREALDTFTEEEFLRAKAVAFWAAAALRRVQLLGQVRRYAALLEQVVEVDQRVFRGDGPEALSPAILEGALPHRRLPRGDAGAADPARPRRGRDVRRRLRGRPGTPRALGPRLGRRSGGCRRRACSTSPSRSARSCRPSRSSSCRSRPPTAGWGASCSSTRSASRRTTACSRRTPRAPPRPGGTPRQHHGRP